MAKQLNTTVISGNVSLYNETDGQSIYPTPMIGMVGLHEDVKMITTISFKNAGDVIYVLGATDADFNGSELQKMMTGDITGRLRDFDMTEIQATQAKLLNAIAADLVASAHDIAEVVWASHWQKVRLRRHLGQRCSGKYQQLGCLVKHLVVSWYRCLQSTSLRLKN